MGDIWHRASQLPQRKGGPEGVIRQLDHGGAASSSSSSGPPLASFPERRAHTGGEGRKKGGLGVRVVAA